VRYYSPFLFTFPEQVVKNAVVPDPVVRERWNASLLRAITEEPAGEPKAAAVVGEKEDFLLRDVNEHPISGVTRRYERLGWSAKTGNAAKDGVIRKGLAGFTPVTTPTGIVKILGLTETGEEYLRKKGVLRERGRHGGAEHEYWKAVVRERLERLGYAVTEEEPVGGGKTVDVHGKRGEDDVWAEVETGRSDIRANIEKLASLPGRRVMVFTAKPLLAEFEALARGVLGHQALLITTSDLEELG
jgi:hypothetical protein